MQKYYRFFIFQKVFLVRQPGKVPAPVAMLDGPGGRLFVSVIRIHQGGGSVLDQGTYKDQPFFRGKASAQCTGLLPSVKIPKNLVWERRGAASLFGS